MKDVDDDHEVFRRGDFVTLKIRGGVWRIERVDPLRGYADHEHMLSLEWVAGGLAPIGRQAKFGSSAVRKLSEMEVIALSSE